MFIAFGDVSLASIMSPDNFQVSTRKPAWSYHSMHVYICACAAFKFPSPFAHQADDAEAVSPRLCSTLVRILKGSLERLRFSLLALQNRRLAALGKDSGGCVPRVPAMS